MVERETRRVLMQETNTLLPLRREPESLVGTLFSGTHANLSGLFVS